MFKVLEQVVCEVAQYGHAPRVSEAQISSFVQTEYVASMIV